MLSRIKQYFIIFYQSFYSVALYRRVAWDFNGMGIGFLMFLIGLLVIPPVVASGLAMNVAFTRVLLPVIKQMPEIVIEKGAATVDVPQPFRIRTRGNREAMIIDTTGAITSLEGEQAFILVTKDMIFTRISNGRILDIRFPKSKRLVVRPGQLGKWGRIGIAPIAIIFFFGLVFKTALKMIGNIVYVLPAAYIFKYICKVPDLRFIHLLRLSIVSMAPGITLSMLMIALSVDKFFYRLVLPPIGILLHTAYIYFAVRSNKGVHPHEEIISVAKRKILRKCTLAWLVLIFCVAPTFARTLIILSSGRLIDLLGNVLTLAFIVFGMTMGLPYLFSLNCKQCKYAPSMFNCRAAMKNNICPRCGSPFYSEDPQDKVN